MSLALAIANHDHSLGNPAAMIQLVEYGDFASPQCRSAYNKVKQLVHTTGNDINFVFRPFPVSKHADAYLAALAAEAAGLQHKFWEMHDLLFENQQQGLSSVRVHEYAAIIGLEMYQFTTDIEDQQVFKQIDNYILSGLQKGVKDTPTFFINGEKYNFNQQEDSLLLYLTGMQNELFERQE